MDIPWSSDHPEADALTHAVEIGVSVEAIADTLGPNALRAGAQFSRRDEARLGALVSARAERVRLLNRLAWLCRCMGNDAAMVERKVANADRKVTHEQLAQMIRTTEAYCRANGVDIRTAAEKAPAGTPQVDYILDLLAQRHRDGDDSGFMRGPTDRAGLEQLTRDEASAYIDSLRGTY